MPNPSSFLFIGLILSCSVGIVLAANLECYTAESWCNNQDPTSAWLPYSVCSTAGDATCVQNTAVSIPQHAGGNYFEINCGLTPPTLKQGCAAGCTGCDDTQVAVNEGACWQFGSVWCRVDCGADAVPPFQSGETAINYMKCDNTKGGVCDFATCTSPAAGLCWEGVCVCNDGYSGPECATVDLCFGVDCNTGSCNATDGTCACVDDGFIGSRCENQTTDFCNARVTLDITNVGYAYNAEHVVVVIDTAALIAAGSMAADCSDFYIVQADMVTAVDFYVESACNTANTRIWVKVDLPAVITTTFYMYTDCSTTGISRHELSFAGSYLTMTNASCPAGAARYSALDNNFPRGALEDTPSLVGVASTVDTHTHLINGSLSGTEMNEWYAVDDSSQNFWWFHARTHTHTFSFVEVDAPSTETRPPFINMVFCAAPTRNIAVNDIIAFTTTSLPACFAPYGILSGKFSYAAAVHDGSGGGQNEHVHLYSAVTDAPDHQRRWFSGADYMAVRNSAGHTHNITGEIGDNPGQSRNVPPYVNVVFRQQVSCASAGIVDDDMIVLATALPPLGFTRVSALSGKFMRGWTSYGGTGGMSSHNHFSQAPAAGKWSIALADNYVLGWYDGLPYAQVASERHVHVGLNSGGSDTVPSLPAYFDVVHAQANVNINVSVVVGAVEVVYHCDDACDAHGTCVGPATCQCDTDWAGVVCTEECTSSCGANGMCVGYDTCLCDTDYAGATCAEFCTSSCLPTGVCVANDTCMCNAGLDNDANCGVPVPEGYYSDATVLYNLPCPPGLLCEGTGTIIPKPTPKGFWSAFGVRAVCDCGFSCSGNSTSVAGESACPAGTWCVQGVSHEITTCSVGRFCPPASCVETNCTAGHICSTTGLAAPNICPAGAFSKGVNQVLCTVCAEGTFTAVPGSITCENCAYPTCSGHGTCEREWGTCTCYKDFSGGSCATDDKAVSAAESREEEEEKQQQTVVTGMLIGVGLIIVVGIVLVFAYLFIAHHQKIKEEEMKEKNQARKADRELAERRAVPEKEVVKEEEPTHNAAGNWGFVKTKIDDMSVEELIKTLHSSMRTLETSYGVTVSE